MKIEIIINRIIVHAEEVTGFDVMEYVKVLESLYRIHLFRAVGVEALIFVSGVPSKMNRSNFIPTVDEYDKQFFSVMG